MSSILEVFFSYYHHPPYFTDEKIEAQREPAQSLELVSVSQIERKGDAAILKPEYLSLALRGTYSTYSMKRLDFSVPTLS